jgi:hypothetical protein
LWVGLHAGACVRDCVPEGLLLFRLAWRTLKPTDNQPLGAGGEGKGGRAGRAWAFCSVRTRWVYTHMQTLGARMHLQSPRGPVCAGRGGITVLSMQASSRCRARAERDSARACAVC